MTDGQGTILTHLLEQLGVPHTQEYTDSRFASMPFHTLFGLGKLLKEYGIDSEGLSLPDKSSLQCLTPPFIAPTRGGLVIVTSVSPGAVGYITRGVSESIARSEFERVWDGTVFLVYPTPASREPNYGLHARIDFFNRAKRWVLLACCVALLAYLVVSRGIYSSPALCGVCAIDILGLWLTYMLVQKSLNIHSDHADHVCGLLDAGGCDSILEQKASKFFGLFGWSEVGFSYFSVSLLCVLLFPDMAPYLAACNILCLPYTFWSIWYQKFRARRWCTLCVSVQASLWALFFCYLLGGYVGRIFPIRIEFFVLGITYVAALLGLNSIMPLLNNRNTPTASEKDENDNDKN